MRTQKCWLPAESTRLDFRCFDFYNDRGQNCAIPYNLSSAIAAREACGIVLASETEEVPTKSFPSQIKRQILVKRFPTFHTVPFFILFAGIQHDDGAVAAILWSWAQKPQANNYRTERRNQVCWQHPLAPALHSYFRLLDVREKQTLNLFTSLFFKFQSCTAEPILNAQLFLSFLNVSIFFEIIILMKFIFAFLYMSLP